MIYLRKSRVKAHTRKEKTGKVTVVREYNDKRVAKNKAMVAALQAYARHCQRTGDDKGKQFAVEAIGEIYATGKLSKKTALAFPPSILQPENPDIDQNKVIADLPAGRGILGPEAAGGMGGGIRPAIFKLKHGMYAVGYEDSILNVQRELYKMQPQTKVSQVCPLGMEKVESYSATVYPANKLREAREHFERMCKDMMNHNANEAAEVERLKKLAQQHDAGAVLALNDHGISPKEMMKKSRGTAMVYLLRKSFVKPHLRHEPTGRTTMVAGYTDRRMSAIADMETSELFHHGDAAGKAHHADKLSAAATTKIHHRLAYNAHMDAAEAYDALGDHDRGDAHEIKAYEHLDIADAMADAELREKAKLAGGFDKSLIEKTEAKQAEEEGEEEGGTEKSAIVENLKDGVKQAVSNAKKAATNGVLIKSRVKQHTRKEKTGKVTVVKEYNDSRVPKMVTRRFTSGNLEGLTHTGLTTAPYKEGQVVNKPIGGSSYVIEKVADHFPKVDPDGYRFREVTAKVGKMTGEFRDYHYSGSGPANAPSRRLHYEGFVYDLSNQPKTAMDLLPKDEAGKFDETGDWLAFVRAATPMSAHPDTAGFKLPARSQRALEVLKNGGYFRRALESQYRGGEKFEYRLRDKSGAVVTGIGFQTWNDLNERGMLTLRTCHSGSTWPTEWELSKTPLMKKSIVHAHLRRTKSGAVPVKEHTDSRERRVADNKTDAMAQVAKMWRAGVDESEIIKTLARTHGLKGEAAAELVADFKRGRATLTKSTTTVKLPSGATIFQKSHVKQYTRRTKTGKVAVVKEHDDKRQKHPDSVTHKKEWHAQFNRTHDAALATLNPKSKFYDKDKADLETHLRSRSLEQLKESHGRITSTPSKKDIDMATSGNMEVTGKKQPKTQLTDLSPELMKKCQRGAPGQGGEVKLNEKEAKEMLAKGVFGLISAGINPNNEDDKKLSEKDIAARDEKLRSELKAKGLKFVKVHGKYGEEEDSYMVLAPDITRDELTELGEKFNQDSVIYSDHNKNEMIFTTGEHKGQRHVGNGFDLLPKEAGDYYTEIALLKKTIKFSLHFDFDRFVKSLFERLFSHIRPLKKSGEAACRKVGDKLGVDWKKVDFDEFCDGMFEEDEHGGNAEESAKIALDHLKEDPKYYSKLKAAGLAGKEK